MWERELVRAGMEGTVVVEWWLSGKKVVLEGRQMGVTMISHNVITHRKILVPKF